MEKVKVQRYVTGKRPEFAPEESSDEEEGMEFNLGKKKYDTVGLPQVKTAAEKEDRRLQRLQTRIKQDDENEDDEDDNKQASR